jgi:hypothetical protein
MILIAILENQMTTETYGQEKDWRLARLIIGVLMTIETMLLINICIALAIFILFMGGIAFLAGGSAASDAQVKATFGMILLMAIAPFTWPILLAISTINIFLRKRPVLIIIFCVLSIIAELGLLLAFYKLDTEGRIKWLTFTTYHILLIVSILIPLAGVVLAFQMKSKLGRVKPTIS